MTSQGYANRVTIQTEISRLSLIELIVDDAPDYFSLIAQNRDHLTQFGDYREVLHASLESTIEDLSNPHDRNSRFGIWLADRLIGRTDLSPRAPGHFVLGYWLGSDVTGNGYATMACQALLRYGRDTLGATDVYAGVTKGNVRSEALLGRLGFAAAEDRDTYTLFQLRLMNAISRES